jgi:hypothetical protein
MLRELRAFSLNYPKGSKAGLKINRATQRALFAGSTAVEY